MLTFEVTKQWNGEPIDDHEKFIHVQLKAGPKGDSVQVIVEAPFFGDPPPPRAENFVGKPFYQLWDYEVVEVFFLCSVTGEYLEVEMGPHGQHLVLLFSGQRQCVRHSLDIEYSAKINRQSGEWIGTASIPKEYLPIGVDKMNIYGIHNSLKEAGERVYEALFQVPGAKPDFHRIEHFQRVDLSSFASRED